MTTRTTPLMLATALLLAPVAATAQGADPAQRLSAYDDAVVAIMKARLPLAQRADRFEALVKGYYDMAGIAALVAGPAWAQASAADRQAAIAALTRHSAVALAKSFRSYAGERFVVDPKVVTRDTGRVVRVTINDDVLYYRLRQAGGQWRIVDVVAGGVSQLAVQRAELARTVAAGGVAGLAQRLRQIDAASLKAG